LPDFSWHNIPKRGKLYQITTTLPNGHQVYQIAVKYFKKIYQHFLSKININWDYWFENKPSAEKKSQLKCSGWKYLFLFPLRPECLLAC
jgi:hypothetical protein